jgi:serine/threonine-protein kinase HipA
MKENVIVFLYLKNEPTAVPAGVFSYDEAERVGEFSYGARYIERPNALPADPVSLPLGVKALPTRLNEGFYGVIRDSLPDYWGRLVFAAKKQIAPEQLSIIDLMLESNATRVGNLDFRLNPKSTEPKLELPYFTALEDIIEAAYRIENNEKVSKHILELYAQGSSMGGARPKCSVLFNNEMWIVKFPSKNDTADIPLIEYATMRLAAECGIDVPEVRLEKIGKKNVFMIKRFDRENTEQGFLRKGFMSALSLMQWDERDRYLWSYYSLADEMRKYMSVDNLKQLYRRMVFNSLVNNTDDHPRNHGFLTEGQTINLSPAYDIVPTFKRQGIGSESSLAMSIGNLGRTISLENILSYFHMFGFKYEEDAVENCIKPLVAVVNRWKEYFDVYGVGSDTIQALQDTFFIDHL